MGVTETILQSFTFALNQGFLLNCDAKIRKKNENKEFFPLKIVNEILNIVNKRNVNFI